VEKGKQAVWEGEKRRVTEQSERRIWKIASYAADFGILGKSKETSKRSHYIS